MLAYMLVARWKGAPQWRLHVLGGRQRVFGRDVSTSIVHPVSIIRTGVLYF